MSTSVMASLNLYNNMSSVLQSVVDSMNLVISAARRVEGATGEMFDSSVLDYAQIELDSIGNKMAKMHEYIEDNAEANDKFNRSLNEGSDIAYKLKSYIVRIGGAYLGFQGVKNLVGLSDELTGINSRLNLIKDSQNDVISLQEKIFQSAQRSRGEYKTTLDVVSKLGIQARNAFKSNDELIGFSEQLNKNFVISGTEAEGVRSVMYNLTQAMATGVLRGQDLNSVMSNAPVILEKVANYLDTDISQIRKLAEEGELTADVIKNALLTSAEQTNEKFEQMPMTFAQIANRTKNVFIKNMEPVAAKLNNLFNSKSFSKFTDNAINAIVGFCNVMSRTLDIIIPMFNLLADNWDWLKYVLLGLLSVFILYKSELFLIDFGHKIVAGSAGILSGVYALLQGQTLAATLAQQGFNVALLSSPIFWIPAIIIGVIFLLNLLIGHINKVKGTSISTVGVICGAIAAAVSFIFNIFIALYNGIVTFIVNLVNGFISFGEFLKNVFKNPIIAIKALFKDALIYILGWAKIVAEVIDTIFGSNFSGAIGKLQTGLENCKNKGIDASYETMGRFGAEDLKINRIDYSDAFGAGHDFGKKIVNSVKGKFDLSNNSNYDGLNDLPMGDPMGLSGKDLGDINKNTKGIKDRLDDGVKFENEDLSYLKELAMARALNEISLEKVVVEVNNSFGDIHENVDLDGWESGIVDGLKNAINQSVSGVGEVI